MAGDRLWRIFWTQPRRAAEEHETTMVGDRAYCDAIVQRFTASNPPNGPRYFIKPEQRSPVGSYASPTEPREFVSGLERTRVRVGGALGGRWDGLIGERGEILRARTAITWSECELLVRFDREVRPDPYVFRAERELWLTYSRIDWAFGWDRAKKAWAFRP